MSGSAFTFLNYNRLIWSHIQNVWFAKKKSLEGGLMTAKEKYSFPVLFQHVGQVGRVLGSWLRPNVAATGSHSSL